MTIRLTTNSADLAHSKVLHVVGDGAAGGGTTAVMQMARGMAARGAQVIIASQAGSYLMQEAFRAGYSILELDFKKRRATVSAARALTNYLRRAPNTLVHAHGARAGLAAAMTPVALRSALIYTVHGFHFSNKPVGVKHLAMAAERACMQRATATVFVSSNDADTARRARLLPKRSLSQVIYNGAEPVETKAEPPLFDVVFLGRLHFQKNPGVLTEILQALAPLRPSLGIIGTGDLEETVRTLAQRARLCDQVSFLGELPHAEALRFLARAKLMLLPSRWEGLPISVIEAMHRGLPVVASDVPGADELVVDGETGFLVPTTDVCGFANRIHQLLVDEKLRARMGTQALARARCEFSSDSQIAAYAALYARALAAGPREVV